MNKALHTALSALAVACTLTLSLAGFAQAATGTLTIGFQQINNPSGCYNSPIVPLIVNNQTDATAIIFDATNCGGYAIGTVAPGQAGTFEFGRSVSIP
ncbi:hypothetical protein [Streptomyces sp. B6B3]|uniref:hypothetical protein n=1 Tax=Streptomyces sp. B6B3 TaxID=3153570 RepID=UPI00325D54E8